METMDTQFSVGRSILAEMDVALHYLANPAMLPALTGDLAEVFMDVDAEWRSAWQKLFPAKSGYHFPLETAARLCGVLLGESYEDNSLVIREMSAESWVQKMAERKMFASEVVDPSLTYEEIFEKVALKWFTSQVQRIGFDLAKNLYEQELIGKQVSTARRILSDGDLHDRFWMLVDRFYYQYYRVWRIERMSYLDRKENLAKNALQNGNSDQLLSWLPARNPLLRYPELRTAVEKDELKVVFWVEPFGLADSWVLYDDSLLVSFADVGLIYENFQKRAEEVANQVKALSDPTRLIILRIIRHFGMINTEIAKSLEISRPTVSVHAKILREAGLIESRQVGREMRHEINIEQVRALYHDLQQFLDILDKE